MCVCVSVEGGSRMEIIQVKERKCSVALGRNPAFLSAVMLSGTKVPFSATNQKIKSEVETDRQSFLSGGRLSARHFISRL